MAYSTSDSKPTAPQIYPKIPEDIDAYRYSKILILEKQLRSEVLKYEKLSKKYGKIRKTFTWLTYVSNAISFGTSSAGIASFAGGVTIIASIPLISVGGLSLLIGTGFTFCSDKMHKKQLKHRETTEAAKTSLINLKRLSSKLIQDGKVTQEELDTILALEQNYNELKMELRRRAEMKKVFKQGQKKRNEDE